MPRALDRPRRAWLRAKLRNYYPDAQPRHVLALTRAVSGEAHASAAPIFANPFTVADLGIFDDETLRDLLAQGAHSLTPEELALALRGAKEDIVRRIAFCLPPEQLASFQAALTQPSSHDARKEARARLLDTLFWEFTYWKTPVLYEELTAGERLHPGIFRRLAPALHGAVVLDAGAGSGRATFACLDAGAAHVYAVEPSPGLRRILGAKLARRGAEARVTLLPGRFDALPLGDAAVDVALSCSAFTAEPESGGEPGIAELRRVTRPGGLIALIWPRPEDYGWLAAHDFSYVVLPVPPRMGVRYRSLPSALRVARRFYARNEAVLRYLLRHQRPEVPFALLGANPPHDFCWQRRAT